jgi:hypothetical protein
MDSHDNSYPDSISGVCIYTVGVTDDGTEIRRRLGSTRGEVIEDLPFNNIQIKIPKENEADIKNLPTVESMNREGEIRFE